MLGSDNLEDAEPEDDLLEKNNNDTPAQDTLERIASCVRFKDLEDGNDTQYLSSSDPNKYSTSKYKILMIMMCQYNVQVQCASTI